MSTALKKMKIHKKDKNVVEKDRKIGSFAKNQKKLAKIKTIHYNNGILSNKLIQKNFFQK